MGDATKKFLTLFVFFSPFTSAFALSGTINLPIIFSLFLFLSLVFVTVKENKIPTFFSVEILLISCFLFFVLLSFVLNGLQYQFSLNHTTAYISSFSLFFLTPLITLLTYKSPQVIYKSVLKWIFIAVLVSSIFSVFEFLLTNFFAVKISEYIPRAAAKEYDPLIVGFLIRSRGFAEESGHFAFMMEIFAPLAIFYLYKSGFCNYKKKYKSLITTTIIFSILMAFSVSSFIIIPFSILVALFINYERLLVYIKRHYQKIILVCFSSFVIWEIINTFIPIYTILEITISEKFNSFSSYDRSIRSDFFWSTFPNLPINNILFGVGPCGFKILGYDESYSFLSLYQTITFEIGIVGIIIMILFLISVSIKIMKISEPIKLYLIVAFISGIIHYNSISNYWYPWFWILCSLIIFIYQNRNLLYEKK